jgi:hypothetical protein
MKRKPSAATVISLVALFFSITSAGIAASHYLITSVSQIQPSVRHALRGRAGRRGPTGPRGPQGPPGQAAPDTTQYVPNPMVVTGDAISVAPAASGTAVADCPLGSYASGGGYEQTGLSVTQSRPAARLLIRDNEWLIDGVNEGTATGTLRAYVVCVAGIPG